MAITTLAGIETGKTQNSHLIKPTSAVGSLIRPHNLLYVGGGFPINASVNANGMAGAAVTSYANTITVPGASNTTYIKAVNINSQSAGTLMICDLLWHNSGLSLTTFPGAQTVNSVAFAARDNGGTADGVGVVAALVITGAVGAGTPIVSIGYTNSDNTAGRSADTVSASLSSTAAGATYFFGMQAGDVGVRSIQSYTQSATWTSGTAHLVAFRPILTVPVYTSVKRYYADITENGLVKLYDSSVLFGLFFASNGTMSGLNATIEYTQG